MRHTLKFRLRKPHQRTCPYLATKPDKSILSFLKFDKGVNSKTEKFACINVGAFFIIQSTLVISKSKGPSKTVRDIRTSTYQNCSIEDKTI